MSTAPTPIDALPTPPSTTDPANFDTRGDALLGALPDFVTQTNAAAQTVYDNAVEAAASSATAEAAKDAAIAVSGAAMWVAATSYATGDAAISPTDLQTYRRESPGGVDATDPALSALWTSVSPLWSTEFGFRNRVVNGNFAINQRGVSGTVVLAAGAYGHDQWKAGASGCTYTFATSAGVTTLTISAGSLIQPIDGDSLRTGTHTLSWTGTAQGKIGAGSYGATGITGSITGGANTTIEFNTGTLSLVQLEPGAKPTVYEFIGKHADLWRCEPYYEVIRYKANNAEAISSYYLAGIDYFQWSFRRVKKSAPTITLVTGAWVGGTPVISVSVDGASFQRLTGGFNASGTPGAVCLSASSPL